MPEFDILHFGVTGFTGKLVLEHFLKKTYDVKLAVCSRNAGRAQAIVDSIAKDCEAESRKPTVLEADLVCSNEEDEAKLRGIVKQAKVVITTAGPFEKYGQTLMKVCAEEGVHYADITGESDFFRSMIAQYDAVARKTGAICVVHCGNDCIPWDCTAFEMDKLAKLESKTLTELYTYTEVPGEFGASGGTINTAVFQLSKSRAKKADGFDELLTDSQGKKSKYSMTNKSPKDRIYYEEFKMEGSTWIMQAVMANCVRRSNALLGYNENLVYSEAMLMHTPTWGEWLSSTSTKMMVGAAIYMPFFSRFLPAPGEGPPREQMESSYLRVIGRGKMQDSAGNVTNIKSEYYIDEDSGYLNTARMLVETGMLLVEMGDAASKRKAAGVITPAYAFGSKILDRLQSTTCTTFKISTD